MQCYSDVNTWTLSLKPCEENITVNLSSVLSLFLLRISRFQPWWFPPFFFVFVQVEEAQGENLRHAFSVWWLWSSVLLWWISELSLTESHFEETPLPDSEWGEGPNLLTITCDWRHWYVTADCLCRCVSALAAKVFKAPQLHRGKEEMPRLVNVDREGANWWFQSKTSICLN